jgi:hypothetical protein
MRKSRVLAPLAALVLLSGAHAPVLAQEFHIQEVASLSEVAVMDLKAKTIVFTDRRKDEIADPDSGLLRFEDWARTRPLQKQALSPFPSYAEPIIIRTVDGFTRRHREKLHLYVAEARVLLSKPPGGIDLTRYATLPFLARLDPAIKHRPITPADVMTRQQAYSHNQHPGRNWCEGRQGAVCIQSHYKLEGKLPIGIMLANKLREGVKKPIADYLEFQSELAPLSTAEIEQAGLDKLTGIDTPVAAALEQNIFYVNQVMQFGKLLAVFQQHPGDADKTVASIYVALAVESNMFTKKKEYAQVPVLRNMVPAQVLAGNSSSNTGNSISAGLPKYARNQIKAIAEIIERE